MHRPSPARPSPARPSPARPTIPTLVAALLAILVLLTGARAADDFDRWYVVSLAGQPAGWARTAQRTAGGLVTTTSELRLTIGRGAAQTSIELSSTFEETPDGRAVSMRSVQRLGRDPVEEAYVFGDGVVERTTRQHGRDRVVEEPVPGGDWLPPAAAARFLEARLAAGASSVVVATLDPMSGLTPVVSTRAIGGRESMEVLGRPATVLKTTLTQSSAPGIEMVEYLDELGLVVRTDSLISGLPMSSMLATRERALAAAKGSGPEIMVRTFVRPDRPIGQPWAVRRAEYVLRVGHGELPAIVSTGVQRAATQEDGSIRVVVDLDKPSAADEADAAAEKYRRPSVMIDGDDPEVRRLAERAVAGSGPGAMERAEAMRRLVYEHVSGKGLGVGFASAGEVARTKVGDCTEHGVLLAAMLRAAGIPSRVASGLVYVEFFAGEREIFGYHLWTQALIDEGDGPRWVDLDATLRAATPFDATHIAIVTSALEDGQTFDALLPLAPLMGELSITVERAE